MTRAFTRVGMSAPLAVAIFLAGPSVLVVIAKAPAFLEALFA